jgi:hypothetical protein
MLLSTFELLLKPRALTSCDSIIVDGRILQGYFLTLANPNPVALQIRLQFNATVPCAKALQGLLIGDTLNVQEFTDLSPTGIYELELPALSTRMVILQPCITDLDASSSAETKEVRGYVEIFVVRRFQLFGFPSSYPLLVTPEHRGTILSSRLSSRQDAPLVYSLPTTCDSSLLNVETVFESWEIKGKPAIPGLPGLIVKPLLSPNISIINQTVKPIKKRQDQSKLALGSLGESHLFGE